VRKYSCVVIREGRKEGGRGGQGRVRERRESYLLTLIILLENNEGGREGEKEKHLRKHKHKSLEQEGGGNKGK